MWIIEDNIYGVWTTLMKYETLQKAQVVLARYVLSPQFSQYQFRIVEFKTIDEG